MYSTLNLDLKKKLGERRGLIVPGVANALSARIAEDMGFEAVYITGAGVTNTYFGLPDMGFVGLTDILNHTMSVRQAVSVPVIVDIDTGFGNAVNVHHTIRSIEHAGANAVQIEDQVMPKRCGHFAGKDVVSRSEAVERVRAAVEARRDPDFQIIARTDSRAVHGLDEALERADLFRKAGADVIFVEAPETREEIERIIASSSVPQILNLVIGGKTPAVSQEDAARMRVGMVLYANVALQAAIAGMQAALGQLKADGKVDETTPGIASFSERQRYVRKDHYDDLEERYATA